MPKQQQKLMLTAEARDVLAQVAAVHDLPRSEVVERLIWYLNAQAAGYFEASITPCKPEN